MYVNSSHIRIELKYKNVIKEAALNVDSEFNDDLYNHLCQKDKLDSGKPGGNVFTCTGILNGKCGERSVRREFTDFYRPPESWTDAIYNQQLESLLDRRNKNLQDDTNFIDVHFLQNCVH